ncbi:MAG: PqqD family protein [Actinomycetota bacterium]
MSVVGPPGPHVTETEVDGCVNVYSPVTRHVLVLNETASDVWRLADGEHMPSEVVTLLAEAYGVERGDVEQDVLGTIASFVGHGLIPPVD